MEKISNRINKMFENLFKTKDNMHLFFKDIEHSEKHAIKYRNNMKTIIKKTIPYKKQKNIPEGKIIEPEYKILEKEQLYQLDMEINNIMNYMKILNIVSIMSQYLIKSNVENENNLYNKISKETDKINIMIIGSGPVGLFLACYLSLYYNRTNLNSEPRVNIVLFDSRIDKAGFRKPYNRQRLFSTSSKYLNLIIPKIYCWNEKENKDYIMVNIFMLEYVLYMIAIIDYNIPMIYNDYSWEDYKNIINKGHFDVVFDCSGGRLQHDAISNINIDWLKNINLSSKKLNRELHIDIDKNLVLLSNDSKHIINYFYGSLTFHYNDKTLTFFDKVDIDIMNKDDLMYLNLLKNKYYTLNETINIIKGITDKTTRNFLYNVLNKKYTNFLVKIDVWQVYMRHAIKISDVFTVNKRKILYIGAGDTIFHSHFITGAGLNRIFDFTVKCANILEQIKVN